MKIEQKVSVKFSKGYVGILHALAPHTLLLGRLVKTYGKTATTSNPDVRYMMVRKGTETGFTGKEGCGPLSG